MGFSTFFTEDSCFVANPNSENGFLSWKDGDFGACGYGKTFELRFVAVGNKSVTLLADFGANVAVVNILLRD